jgi:dTDP-4-amino-4,6-dideoxygalactose transaminase
MYYKYLDKDKFYLPSVRNNCNDVPFCLPIICRNANLKAKAIDICNSLSIEYRPIISGFLGYQTCYKKYFNTLSKENFVNSIFLHENGFYIGLHSGVSSDDILFITSQLNNI